MLLVVFVTQQVNKQQTIIILNFQKKNIQQNTPSSQRQVSFIIYIMNFFPTKQQQHNTEESEAMIRDLEAPLLSEDESSVVNTIHTAVPLLLKTNNDIGIVHRAHTIHVSPPCQGYSKNAASKVGNVDFVHVSPPCQSYISKGKFKLTK